MNSCGQRLLPNFKVKYPWSHGHLKLHSLVCFLLRAGLLMSEVSLVLEVTLILRRLMKQRLNGSQVVGQALLPVLHVQL